MSDVIYPVDAATLPAGSCPSTYQELADLLASIYSVTVSTNNTGIVVSATKPADTTVVWKQLDSSGNPVRDYVFVGGLWLSPHAVASGIITIYEGDISAIATFDGGDANPVSSISGPMWEEVTALRARLPVGVGTFPSGTAVAVTGTGGEEKHLLTTDELASHTHPAGSSGELFATFKADYSADNLGNEGLTNVSNQQLVGSRASTGAVSATSNAHNTLPPYYGVYFIRRTARKFYVVP